MWCHQESNRGHKDFQSFALPTELWHQACKIRLALKRVVPPGIEPGTQGFSVLCSTNWAMAPQGAHVSFAIAKVGSFSETTKFLPCFLVCFALFGSHFILSTWFCDEKALQSDPDGIQTHDLQNRNLTLYSAKLRSLFPCKNTAFLRLDQTILLFHPFALHWLWRILHCACNTYDLLDLRSELPTKNSHVFRKISYVFQKISHVFWKISHFFYQTSEINLKSTRLSFPTLHAGVTTTANRGL